MAYASGIANDFWSKYYQRRAQKGSGLSASEMAALYEPTLAYDYQKSLAAADRAQNQANLDRNYELQRKRDEDAAAAAKMSGITSIVGTGANIYLAKNLIDVYKGAGAKGALSSPSYVAPAAEFSPATPAVVPGAANVGATVPALDAAYGGAQAALPTTAGASAPELAAGTGMGEGLSATYGAEAAATPGPLATAGYVGGAVAAGYAARQGGKAIAPYVEEYTGVPERYTEAGSTTGGMGIIGEGAKDITKKITGSETAGDVVKFVVNPVQGAVDEAGELLGTVICTELARQGLIPDRMRRVGMIFGARAGFDVYKGYRILADPVVVKMQQSRNYTKFVAFLAIPTMREMAHRLGCNDKGTLLGKAVLAVGIPLCRRAYRKSMEGSVEMGVAI